VECLGAGRSSRKRKDRHVAVGGQRRGHRRLRCLGNAKAQRYRPVTRDRLDQFGQDGRYTGKFTSQRAHPKAQEPPGGWAFLHSNEPGRDSPDCFGRGAQLTRTRAQTPA
jgi:hypothetical protein